MSAAIIFVATYVVVVCLGFQSLTVNHGHYRAAFFNSFLISGANLVILHFVPKAHGDLEYLAYMTGGPLGIVTSMWIFRRTLGKRKSGKWRFVTDSEVTD